MTGGHRLRKSGVAVFPVVFSVFENLLPGVRFANWILRAGGIGGGVERGLGVDRAEVASGVAGRTARGIFLQAGDATARAGAGS